MTDLMNLFSQQSNLDQVLIIIAVFFGLIQLVTLAGVVFRGASASLLPGLIAVGILIYLVLT